MQKFHENCLDASPLMLKHSYPSIVPFYELVTEPIDIDLAEADFAPTCHSTFPYTEVGVLGANPEIVDLHRSNRDVLSTWPCFSAGAENTENGSVDSDFEELQEVADNMRGKEDRIEKGKGDLSIFSSFGFLSGGVDMEDGNKFKLITDNSGGTRNNPDVSSDCSAENKMMTFQPDVIPFGLSGSNLTITNILNDKYESNQSPDNCPSVGFGNTDDANKPTTGNPGNCLNAELSDPLVDKLNVSTERNDDVDVPVGVVDSEKSSRNGRFDDEITDRDQNHDGNENMTYGDSASADVMEIMSKSCLNELSTDAEKMEVVINGCQRAAVLRETSEGTSCGEDMAGLGENKEINAIETFDIDLNQQENEMNKIQDSLISLNSNYSAGNEAGYKLSNDATSEETSEELNMSDRASGDHNYTQTFSCPDSELPEDGRIGFETIVADLSDGEVDDYLKDIMDDGDYEALSVRHHEQRMVTSGHHPELNEHCELPEFMAMDGRVQFAEIPDQSTSVDESTVEDFCNMVVGVSNSDPNFESDVMETTTKLSQFPQLPTDDDIHIPVDESKKDTQMNDPDGLMKQYYDDHTIDISSTEDVQEDVQNKNLQVLQPAKTYSDVQIFCDTNEALCDSKFGADGFPSANNELALHSGNTSGSSCMSSEAVAEFGCTGESNYRESVANETGLSNHMESSQQVVDQLIEGNVTKEVVRFPVGHIASIALDATKVNECIKPQSMQSLMDCQTRVAPIVQNLNVDSKHGEHISWEKKERSAPVPYSNGADAMAFNNPVSMSEIPPAGSTISGSAITTTSQSAYPSGLPLVSTVRSVLPMNNFPNALPANDSLVQPSIPVALRSHSVDASHPPAGSMGSSGMTPLPSQQYTMPLLPQPVRMMSLDSSLGSRPMIPLVSEGGVEIQKLVAPFPQNPALLHGTDNFCHNLLNLNICELFVVNATVS